jgi:hypothetical protein
MPESDPVTPIRTRTNEHKDAGGLIRQETLLSVLGERARSQSVRHLEAAAVIGAADFVALALIHPSLWWIAVGSLALSSYGVWGLADRALEPESESRVPSRVLRVIRVSSVVVGIASGVAAVLGLMAVATQGWIL